MMGARILELYQVAAVGKTADMIKASINVPGDNPCFKDLIDHAGNIASLVREREARRATGAAIEFQNPANYIMLGPPEIPAVFIFLLEVLSCTLVSNLKTVIIQKNLSHLVYLL